jgi:DNA-binding CsgD family transcriptional regulator/tetratricopeptide (TPR) repeat protein
MIDGVSRRGSSPVFVGRHAEFDRLVEAFGRAAQGQPSLVLVAGEAGVGKSRLVAEFAEHVETDGGWTASGGCLDLGEGGLPYAPVVEAIRTLTQRIEADRRSASFGRSMEVLATIVPELRRPDLDRTPYDRIDPSGRQVQLFDAIVDLLDRASGGRPLMVTLEDIHWADGSTRDLIRFLVRNLRTERLLLVATYRSDDLHRRHPLMPLLSELDRADRVERVELRRFDREELAEQITAILGRRPSAAHVDVLLERSDGIPFYVEELIAHDGRVADPIPTSLRDILDHRLAALSPNALDLVRAAAVIGGRFSHERLAAVAGLDEDVLLRALREAIDSRIVVSLDAGDPAYMFRHALLREAAYDDLLPAERVRIHSRLADHLESMIGSGTTEDAAVFADLALHAYHAHDLGRALVGAVRAIDALVMAAAYREALRHAERALELWPRVAGAEARTGIDHAGLLTLAARIAGNAGDPTRAVAFDQAALLEVAADADQERRTRLLVDLWVVAWEAGAFDIAVAVSTEALGIVGGLPASSLKARVLVTAGSDRWTAGRIRDAVRLYEASMALAREIGDDWAWVIAASPLAHSLAILGRPGRGESLVDEVRATAVPFEGSAWEFWVAIDQAMALWFAGRFEDSLHTDEIALRTAIRYGLEDRFGPFLFPSEALFELGRYDEVEELLERALGFAIAEHPMAAIASIATRTHLVRGRLDEARAAMARWPVAVTDGTSVWRCESSILLARAHGRFGDLLSDVEAARARAVDGDDDGPLWFALSAGIGGAADQAVLARRRRRSADASTAADLASSWFGHLSSMATDARADGGAGPFFEAIFATAEAETARARGDHTPAGWTDALGRWIALKHPYGATYAGLRLTEAILDTNGDRKEAAAALRRAHTTAASIGARPLHNEIEAVATRGRIDLELAGSTGPHGPDPAPTLLTARERDVVRLVAEGHTNREIGDRLFISEKTVSVHVSNAMAKLGALSRYEAASTADRLGLL